MGEGVSSPGDSNCTSPAGQGPRHSDHEGNRSPAAESGTGLSFPTLLPPRNLGTAQQAKDWIRPPPWARTQTSPRRALLYIPLGAPGGQCSPEMGFCTRSHTPWRAAGGLCGILLRGGGRRGEEGIPENQEQCFQNKPHHRWGWEAKRRAGFEGRRWLGSGTRVAASQGQRRPPPPPSCPSMPLCPEDTALSVSFQPLTASRGHEKSWAPPLATRLSS